MTTTSAISQGLPPPLPLGLGVSFDGFAIKVSSVDENDQSTAINAQPLNGFHAGGGNRRKTRRSGPPAAIRLN
ncbi:hypothetical protein C1D09_002570 [Mesorhizobium intechi]|uniref:Uncharacterized protein n=1 Tax=Mesorhizobium intechi TaxID=537601 RepID=A0A8T9B0H9_9HYPH|nr:hypothetical protein C1D09_002570 [Mesorhizobium intechi]